MNIGDSTTNQADSENCGLVVVQFIGRLVFVAKMRIENSRCYLTDVRNIRYWAERPNGLGDFSAGPKEGDKIDRWPDTVLPYDKLLSYMAAWPEPWE